MVSRAYSGVGSKVAGGELRCFPCYLLNNKIIMLLSGKYSMEALAGFCKCFYSICSEL